MSGLEHTPGPWVLTDDVGQWVEAVKGDRTMPVAHTTGYCIAHGESRMANARLIAAAPDAFGLAVDFIQWVDRFSGTLPDAQSEALFDLYRRARQIYRTVDEEGHDASRAAGVAKATGSEAV